jgi:protein LSM14
LVSKKNIRYEGVLYSINESDSTLALQNVKSFGTEGREKTDPETNFVAPQDAVHPYLLFRGCDIKDLHVHEEQNKATEKSKATEKKQAQTTTKKSAWSTPKSRAPSENEKKNESAQQTRSKQQEDSYGGRGSGNNRRPRKQNPTHQVGTGASLLNRKARGTVNGGEFVLGWAILESVKYSTYLLSSRP